MILVDQNTKNIGAHPPRQSGKPQTLLEWQHCQARKSADSPADLSIVQGKFACKDRQILQRNPDFTWKINNKAGRRQ
ncbi:hypothetical protein QJS63_20020 [Pseudomonas juntendi]|nr:hypothetical protein QJS63_20020 [Pseudomonas juntendi]